MGFSSYNNTAFSRIVFNFFLVGRVFDGKKVNLTWIKNRKIEIKVEKCKIHVINHLGCHIDLTIFLESTSQVKSKKSTQKLVIFL
jgi:hypothetical protein